jgi:PTH1 family peptidyl-tRNA hydrolase
MIRLAVGLGNPGSKYESTRHNLGRLVVERFADQREEKFKKETEGAQTATLHSFFLDGSALRLAVLSTYMNESGAALNALLRFHKIPPAECLVVFDDFSIPFGTLRIRRSGSAGGHNGVKSIIETVGTEDFPRLRLGIGPVPEPMDPADFVLQKFSREEKARLEDFIGRGAQALEACAQDFERAMNEYNRSVGT